MLLLAVSVLATATMFYRSPYPITADSDNPGKAISSKAKMIFDEIGYHLKKAGYGMSGNQKGIDIRNCENMDSLIIRYRGLETIFFVECELGEKSGVLYKSVAGSSRVVAAGVARFKFRTLTSRKLDAQIAFAEERKIDDEEIGGLRVYSAILPLGHD